MITRRIRIELIDEMLATNPGDPEIHEKFIASKAPDAETRSQELEHMSADELVSKEMTVFYRDAAGNPQIPCYHMYGFFKSSCGFLRNVKGTESSKIKAYKKKIDGLIKVYSDANDIRGRYINLNLDGMKMGTCQRPLRASTMQGERVALANSETVPEGTWFECDIVCFDDTMWPAIEEWLDYGKYNGLDQWRSSGKGAFIWKYVNESA